MASFARLAYFNRGSSHGPHVYPALARQRGRLRCPVLRARGDRLRCRHRGQRAVVDNSLLSRDLRDNAAVLGRDVVNDNVPGGGLTGSDVHETTLGPVPAAGSAGFAGCADFSNYAGAAGVIGGGQEIGDVTPIGAFDNGESSASCPPGYLATGGGYAVGRDLRQRLHARWGHHGRLLRRHEDADGDGNLDTWTVAAGNDTSDPDGFVEAAVECVGGPIGTSARARQARRGAQRMGTERLPTPRK